MWQDRDIDHFQNILKYADSFKMTQFKQRLLPLDSNIAAIPCPTVMDELLIRPLFVGYLHPQFRRVLATNQFYEIEKDIDVTTLSISEEATYSALVCFLVKVTANIMQYAKDEAPLSGNLLKQYTDHASKGHWPFVTQSYMGYHQRLALSTLSGSSIACMLGWSTIPQPP